MKMFEGMVLHIGSHVSVILDEEIFDADIIEFTSDTECIVEEDDGTTTTISFRKITCTF